jgi:glucokinase
MKQGAQSMSKVAKAIGIDVGGTNLRIGVFETLNLIEETRFQADFSTICKNNTPAAAWQTIINVTTDAINSVLTSHPDIAHIGIGFPGFINPDTHAIAQSPNLPGLQHVNLADDLTHRLQKTVIVENDANAAAFGEYCLAGKPKTGLIYLGLGTGVGGGLILNGQPHVGHHGCAMEAGHITVVPEGRLCGCGNLGCMEQYASASGVSLSYQEATHRKHTAADIAAFATAGDKDAIHAYHIAANALAQALASILKVVDVQHVVIGGGMAGAWDLMENTFNQRLNNDLIPVLQGKIKVERSTAHDRAGMLGAAMLASQ